MIINIQSNLQLKSVCLHDITVPTGECRCSVSVQYCIAYTSTECQSQTLMSIIRCQSNACSITKHMNLIQLIIIIVVCQYRLQLVNTQYDKSD